MRKSTTEQFIKKAISIHGDKYDYSKVNYINAQTKVTIICPVHGEFYQTPNAHTSMTNKCGCPRCSMSRYPSRGKSKRRTTNDFIQHAREIHGNKYDYSKVNYINNHKKVEIICPEHGSFWQAPTLHTHGGNGCPKCRESKGERIIRVWLEDHDIEYVKEYSFSDCVNIKPLHFDFYLPAYNMCIEFDGLQHFIEDDFYTKVNKLEYIQQNDQIKTKYCKTHNITLLRISYNQIGKINSILKGEILNYG